MPMNDAQLAEILKSLSPILASAPSVADPPTMTVTTTQAEGTTKKPQKTCGCCRRKLTLTDFDCGKCKSRFCAQHRLPEEHSCGHDFVAEGRTRLTEQLTKVIAKKLDHI